MTRITYLWSVFRITQVATVGLETFQTKAKCNLKTQGLQFNVSKPCTVLLTPTSYIWLACNMAVSLLLEQNYVDVWFATCDQTTPNLRRTPKKVCHESDYYLHLSTLLALFLPIPTSIVRTCSAGSVYVTTEIELKTFLQKTQQNFICVCKCAWYLHHQQHST